MARACWNWRIRQFRVLDLSWVMASVPGCLIFFPLEAVADLPSEIMCTFIKKTCSPERRSLVFWILFSILNKIMANEIKISYLSLQFQTIFIFIHKEFRHNGFMHRTCQVYKYPLFYFHACNKSYSSIHSFNRYLLIVYNVDSLSVVYHVDHSFIWQIFIDSLPCLRQCSRFWGIQQYTKHAVAPGLTELGF